MKNLKTLVEESKCRRGPSDGTTSSGAYWLACDPILIHSCGGDGIGNSSADVNYFLELRHFRAGTVEPVLVRSVYHQNSGKKRYVVRCLDLLKCDTSEKVIISLKLGVCFPDCFPSPVDVVISDLYAEKYLLPALSRLGMVDAEPGPDDD